MKNYKQPNWNSHFKKNTKNISNCNLCLEIGAFEGLTSNYIVDNLLSKEGKLICLDPLENQYLVDNLTEKDVNMNKRYGLFKGQYERFINNVSQHIESGKIQLIRQLSVNAFPHLLTIFKGQFDFIYVDGDHRTEGVYIDAINSIKLCKTNGFILFDDYHPTWSDTVKGIDKFLIEYKGQYKIIKKEYQVLIQKVSL